MPCRRAAATPAFQRRHADAAIAAGDTLIRHIIAIASAFLLPLMLPRYCYFSRLPPPVDCGCGTLAAMMPRLSPSRHGDVSLSAALIRALFRAAFTLRDVCRCRQRADAYALLRDDA